jgi:hypothetical protein
MEVTYLFVNYGEILNPVENVLALDVGMKTIPGVIDHHHPQDGNELSQEEIEDMLLFFSQNYK